MMGFGILSTDRPESLKRLLSSMSSYSKKLDNVFIFDDSSEVYKEHNIKLAEEFRIPFFDTGNRIGVSANTNYAIEYLYNNYEYFAIMNNDLEIRRNKWENFYINAMKKTEIHHFCFRQYGLFGSCKMGDECKFRNAKPDTITDINRVKIATVKDKSNGVLLTFTGELIDKVGYFDELIFPKYGREHNDYSNRVSMSGIQISGIHDVFGSNDYFKLYHEDSVVENSERIHSLRDADRIYNQVKNDKNRIYVSKNKTVVNNTNRVTIEYKKSFMKEVLERKPVNKSKTPISIILTAYQTQDYIEETLDSIENQTYFKNNDNYEILLGIDGCKDTIEKVKSIRSKYRNLRVFMMNKNVGTYITSNTMLSLCKYDYILRFDTDDIMKLNMITILMKHKDHNMVRFQFDDFKTNINQAKKKFRCAHGVCLYKKDLLKILGGYRSWICAADTDFVHRMEVIGNIFELKEQLFYRRVHGQSLTTKEGTDMKSKLRLEYKVFYSNPENYTRDKIYVKPVISKFTEI